MKGGSNLYGYTEKLAEDGTYTLATIYPDPGMAQTFWKQRAIELCGSSDYTATIFREDRPVVGFHHYGDGARVGNFVLEGFLECSAMNVEGGSGDSVE